MHSRWQDGDRIAATREGFAWLLEMLTRAPEGTYRRVAGRDAFEGAAAAEGDPHLRHPAEDERSLPGTYDVPPQGIGLAYDRLTALSALTARSFEGAARLNFFDHFDASRDTALHALAVGRAERFAPRLYERDGAWYALYPDPVVGACGATTCAPLVEETYGAPATGHLAAYRALLIAHAYAEAPVFADGARPAWIAQLPAEPFAGAACGYGEAFDGDPVCARAEDADYAIHRGMGSLALVASAHPVGPRAPRLVSQRPPGFDLLVELIDLQRRIAELEAASSPTVAARRELEELHRRRRVQESVAQALLEVQALLGAGSWLPR